MTAWRDRDWRAAFRRYELAIVCATALAVLLPGLGSFTLIDPWEGHYGEVARRILEDNDWVKPRWQNEVFRSKPILSFWAMAASLGAHGVATDGGYSGEMIAQGGLAIWALRLPFALFGAAGLVLLWFALARTAGRRPAWLCFGVLATTPFYTLVARQAITDMPMVATTAGAMACFLLALDAGDAPLRSWWRRFNAYHLFALVLGALVGWQVIYNLLYFVAHPGLGRGVTLPAPHLLGTLPCAAAYAGFLALNRLVFRVTTRRQVLLFWAYFLLGLSALAKGPPGVITAVAAVGLYILVTGQWRLLLRLCVLEGALIFLLVAAPWHLAMALADGRAWLNEYFGHHMSKRALRGVHGDTGTFDYYAAQIGIGLFPWVGLLPAALTGALTRARDRLRGDPARLVAAAWALAGLFVFCFVRTKFHHYVLPVVPAFAILIGLWLDDVLAGRTSKTGLAAAVAVLIVGFVAVDLAGEQKQLIELFIYRYDRPWPSGPPYNVDVGGVFLGFGVAFALVAGALGVASRSLPLRRPLVGGLAGLALVYSLWATNGYMRTAAPHWGQRALHETYFRQRAIHGVDIVYASLRDLADDWSGGRRVIEVESLLPDDFTTGRPMNVHLEAPGDVRHDLAGKVSRVGDGVFWIEVEDVEVARLRGDIERGKSGQQRRRRPWMQVNADRMLAWQLNWRGENFWQTGEIWGRTKDTQTVFVKTDNKAFLEYLNDTTRHGRRYFLITEAARADRLRNVLPTERAKQTLRKLDTSCNKFTLVLFTL